MLKLIPVIVVVTFLQFSPTLGDELIETAAHYEYGTILGRFGETAWTKKQIAEFHAIKYAESPVGRHRFMPPRAYIPDVISTINATTPGRQCPNIKNVLENDDTGDREDCLHLSVFCDQTKNQLPVMVYFHGGSLVFGQNTGSDSYPPYYLLEGDIVLVVVQYRLGPLGFYATLTDDAPGNVAVLDCIMALEWVQDHIDAFGGDPRRVTVFGQSDGAAIVNALAFSPQVDARLFNRVILQSGSLISPWTIDEHPVEHSVEIALFSGCRSSTIAGVNSCMRSATVRDLLLGHQNHVTINSVNGPDYFGGHKMVIGGPTALFPTHPFNMWMSGNYRQNLSLMAGVTKNDGTYPLTGAYNDLSANDAEFNQFRLIDTMNRYFGAEEITGSLTGLLAKQLFTKSQIKSGNWTEMANGLIDLAGIQLIKGPVLRSIQANARVNSHNTFLYTFDYKGAHTRFGFGGPTSHLPFNGGVHHSDDNIYLFPWPQNVSDLNERDTEIAKRMVSLWTTFAANGIPSAPGVPQWPPVTEIFGPYMHINENATIGDDFLDEFSVASRNVDDLLKL